MHNRVTVKANGCFWRKCSITPYLHSKQIGNRLNSCFQFCENCLMTTETGSCMKCRQPALGSLSTMTQCLAILATASHLVAIVVYSSELYTLPQKKHNFNLPIFPGTPVRLDRFRDPSIEHTFTEPAQ